MRSGRSAGRMLAGLGLALAGLLLPPGAAHGRTPDHVFLRTAGRYRETRVLEEQVNAESTLQLVEFVNHQGRAPARAYIRRPHALAEDYHILLTYVGRRTGVVLLDIIPDQPDRVLVAIQYPYRKPRGPFGWLGVPNRLRQTGYRAVAGGLLAMDHLAAEGLDPARVTVIGASFGAGFATIHGALDPRVARVLIVHGSGDYRAVFRHLLRRHRRGWARPFLGAACAIVAPFEPVRYAGRIAPRPFTIIGARQDDTFTEESVRALYAAAAEPKQLIWTETGHVRSRADDVSKALVRLATESLLESAASTASSPGINHKKH